VNLTSTVGKVHKLSSNTEHVPSQIIYDNHDIFAEFFPTLSSHPVLSPPTIDHFLM